MMMETCPHRMDGDFYLLFFGYHNDIQSQNTTSIPPSGGETLFLQHSQHKERETYKPHCLLLTMSRRVGLFAVLKQKPDAPGSKPGEGAAGENAAASDSTKCDTVRF